jgi:hypothetical protein
MRPERRSGAGHHPDAAATSTYLIDHDLLGEYLVTALDAISSALVPDRQAVR